MSRTGKAFGKLVSLNTLFMQLAPYHPITLNLNHGCSNIKYYNEAQNDLVMIDCYLNHPGGVYNDAHGVRKYAPWKALLYYVKSFTIGWNRSVPSPEQFINYSYQALVNGATIIAPFHFSTRSIALRNAWRTLATEMEEMGAALYPEYFTSVETTPEKKAGASFRKDGVKSWIIAVSIDEKPGKIELKIPEGHGPFKEAEVMFENRKIKVKDGKIIDNFNTWGQACLPVDKIKGVQDYVEKELGLSALCPGVTTLRLLAGIASEYL